MASFRMYQQTNGCWMVAVIETNESAESDRVIIIEDHLTQAQASQLESELTHARYRVRKEYR